MRNVYPVFVSNHGEDFGRLVVIFDTIEDAKEAFRDLKSEWDIVTFHEWTLGKFYDMNLG